MSKEFALILDEYRKNYDLTIANFIDGIMSYKTYRRKVNNFSQFKISEIMKMVDKSYYSRGEFFKAAIELRTKASVFNRFLNPFAYEDDKLMKDAYDTYLNSYETTPEKIEEVENHIKNYQKLPYNQAHHDLSLVASLLERRMIRLEYEYLNEIISKVTFYNYLDFVFTEKLYDASLEMNYAITMSIYYKYMHENKKLDPKKFIRLLNNKKEWLSNYYPTFIASRRFFSSVCNKELIKIIDLYEDHIKTIEEIIEIGLLDLHLQHHYFYHKANLAYLKKDMETFELFIAKYIVGIRIRYTKEELKSIYKKLQTEYKVDIVEVVKKLLSTD